MTENGATKARGAWGGIYGLRAASTAQSQPESTPSSLRLMRCGLGHWTVNRVT